MTQPNAQITAFGDYLKANPEDAKALEGLVKDGDALDATRQFAEQRGFVFSAEALDEALSGIAESGALSDSALEGVSGGAGYWPDEGEGDEVIFSIIYRHVGTTLLGARRPRF